MIYSTECCRNESSVILALGFLVSQSQWVYWMAFWSDPWNKVCGRHKLRRNKYPKGILKLFEKVMANEQLNETTEVVEGDLD